MPLKNKGFTMIELLVCMGLIAMMVALAVPNFTKMAQEFTFDKETREVFDLFNEVRSKALSYKKCPNQETAIKWEIRIDGVNDQFLAKCISDSTPNPAAFASIDFNISTTRSRLSSIRASDQQNQLDTPSAANINDVVAITYLPGHSQIIPTSDPNGSNIVHNFLKLELSFDGTNMKKSICLNRIAGFNLLNNIDNQCQNVF